MPASALSPEESAGERDDRLAMVELAVEAGADDPYEYRMGVRDAVAAARWGAAADAGDAQILELLRTAGQLAAAVATSIAGDEPTQLPISGRLRAVPPGLPPEAQTGAQWAEAIWAATVAGDAASATTLARRQVDAHEGPAGEAELAQAVAALWRGERAGPHLIAALRASDPESASGAERDRRLDETTPAIAVFRHVLDGTDEEVRDALRFAADAFAKFWDDRARRTDPGRAVSLPLSGLARIAIETGRSLGDLPARVIAAQPIGPVLLCPVCASPFDPLEPSCRWCHTDLSRDAPLETSLGAHLIATAAPCPVCAHPNRDDALRCWNCHSSLHQ